MIVSSRLYKPRLAKIHPKYDIRNHQNNISHGIYDEIFALYVFILIKCENFNFVGILSLAQSISCCHSFESKISSMQICMYEVMLIELGLWNYLFVCANVKIYPIVNVSYYFFLEATYLQLETNVNQASLGHEPLCHIY